MLGAQRESQSAVSLSEARARGGGEAAAKSEIPHSLLVSKNYIVVVCAVRASLWSGGYRI